MWLLFLSNKTDSNLFYMGRVRPSINTHKPLKRDEMESFMYINLINVVMLWLLFHSRKGFLLYISLNLSFDICFLVLNATRFVDFLCNNK